MRCRICFSCRRRFHTNRSDDRCGWNDGIERLDGISFKIEEVFKSGRNPYQITARPGPDERTRVTQADRDRAELERVEKRANRFTASRQREGDHATAVILPSAEQ